MTNQTKTPAFQTLWCRRRYIPSRSTVVYLTLYRGSEQSRVGSTIPEITISAGSPGKTLSDTTWPPGWIPATAPDNHTSATPTPASP